jgi:hypothetical protein
MPGADVVALGAAIADGARTRFVRWDEGLWRELVHGPAARLAAGLGKAGVADAAAVEGLLRSYLTLACEGVGLGYLYPSAAGRDAFFNLAFHTLLPRDLPLLPPARWGEALAQCWNLGENLEGGAAWLRRLFARRLAQLASLAELEAAVADVSRQALEPPAARLGARARQVWVTLADEDRRFLPGAVHFLAPTVVCVHDRLRTGGGGRDAEALGVWLGDPPLVLGALRCEESVAPDGGAALPDPLRATLAADARVTELAAGAVNEWRAAVAQTTSQLLVALYPDGHA